MKQNKTTKSNDKTETTDEKTLIIQNATEFTDSVKSLYAKSKVKSVKEMTDSEVYSWIVEAEEALPRLIATIKSVKDEMIEEEGKIVKSSIGVVTGKFEKSKIKFAKLRKVVEKQMVRVKNIKTIAPIVSPFVKPKKK